MSPTDFRSFLAKKNAAIEKVITQVTSISEEDDWMSSEKIDILINEIRGLRKDIGTMMNEMRNTSVEQTSYMPVQESTQKPRIMVHREGQQQQVAESGHNSDFDSHVAALC